MARSQRFVFVAFALLYACSAKKDQVGVSPPQCPEGFTCEPGNAEGDGDADGSSEDGTSEDGSSEDGSEMGGEGDGDATDGSDDDGMSSDDAGTPPPSHEGECKPEHIVPEGCVPEVANEGTINKCDGADNDCDGRIDEGCACVPGTVQRCFAGPPGRRRVGGCEDGTQVCEGTEFGSWGECTGGKLPSDEVCDSLDNDCNGCIDEIDDCQPQALCPAPGDPRIPDGKPFSTYPLRGADFVTDVASVVSWKWTVQGTPCDQLFLGIPGSPATADNGQLSFKLVNGTTQDASLVFTLSGDYTVTMTATMADGTVIECTWVVHVRAPGVRVELCWDVTGPTASSNAIDVDLHMGKHGATTRWFTPNDCYYSNCKTTSLSTPAWGYGTSGADACPNGLASCPNPRLDIDNISETTKYTPENINVDKPLNGDKFRVMVHYFDFASGLATHPLVNVYCGGELRGSFGAGANQLVGFDTGGGDNQGDMWRVADITSQVDAAGVTTGCALAPLVDATGKPIITTSDSTF